MAKNILTLVAGIVAVNILLVTRYAIAGVRDESLRRREIRELEAILHAPGRGAQHRPRLRHTRLAGVLVVTLVLGVTTALASPQGRGVVTSVLGMVARGLQGQPAAQEAARVGGDQSPPVGVRGGASWQASAGLPDGRESTLPPSRTSEHASSDSTSSTPPSDGPSVPASPTAVTAVSVSSGQVRVDWVDVSEEAGYRVERSMDGLTGWVPAGSTSRDVTTTVDGSLSAGTTYYYRVFATNAGGDSVASSVASATTSVDPAAPTTVTAIATSASQIELNWTDVSGETGYRVERMLEGDANWLILATTGEDVTEFIDAGLAAGATYSYRVFATNAGGDSVSSDVVVATTGSDPIIEP